MNERVFSAIYFDGKTSRVHRVVVRVESTRLVIQTNDGLEQFIVSIQNVRVESPLGSTRRMIHFGGGSHLETWDNDAVSEIENYQGIDHAQRLMHKAEAKLSYVLVALVILVLAGWLTVRFAMPETARRVALAVPEESLEALGETLVDNLDGILFQKSNVDSWRKDAITRRFREFCNKVGLDHPLPLHFRSFKGQPNAFALPSGDIIVTDEMLDFVESDAELMGVFAHEIAHFKERHAIRKVFQDAGLVFLASTIVGDVASAGTLISTLPTTMIKSSYSRDFELKADEVGAGMMIKAGLPVAAMANLFGRLEKFDKGHRIEAVSSHPANKKRIDNLRDKFGKDPAK